MTRTYIANRKLTVESKKNESDAAAAALKLSNENEVNIRDHYAKEVAALRGQMASQSKRHSDELDKLRKQHKDERAEDTERHDKCLADRDVLRAKVDALRDYVAALNRTIVSYSARTAIALGDEPSEDVRAAALRVEELFKILPPAKPVKEGP